MDNLGEMDKFLETHNLPKLSQEEAENLNRLIITREIKTVIKKKTSQCTKALDQMASQENVINRSKNNTYPSQTIPKNSRKEKTSKLF